MPFKKTRSPYYYVSKNLPGFGETGTISTKSTRYDRAVDMEKMLVELSEQEHYDLLQALKPQGKGKSGILTLSDLMRAKKENALLDLKRQLSNPNLHEAARAYGKLQISGNQKLGLKHLIRMAPGNVRLSWLKDPGNVNAMVQKMIAEGYTPNYVKNSLWTAISKLFQHYYGKDKARTLLSDAQRPSANDRREVWLASAEVHKLVSSLDWEMRMFIIVSASTGVDTSPILGIRPRSFSLAAWKVTVFDTKTEYRTRTMRLPAIAVYALKLLSDGKEPNDRIFSLSKNQVYHRWVKAIKECGLTKEAGFKDNVRPKDLRHTFSVHYVMAGGNVVGLADRLGHGRVEQSLVYAKHSVQGGADVEAGAALMGLSLPEDLEAQVPRPEEAEQEPLVVPLWWFDRNAGPEGPRQYVPRGTAGYGTEAYKEDLNERRREQYAKARAAGIVRKEAIRISGRKPEEFERELRKAASG